VVDKHLHPTRDGTPQGGIISPLLANIALDQMEHDLVDHLRSQKGWKSLIGNYRQILRKRKDKDGTTHVTKISAQPRLRLIRYADDFVVIHEDKKVVTEAKIYIEQWL